MSPVPHATLYRPNKAALWGPIRRAARMADSWALVERFFTECTVPEAPEKVMITVMPASPTSAELMRMLARYGPPTRSHPARAGGIWERPGDELAELAAFVTEGQPSADADVGVADFAFQRHFRWRDPRTGEAVPHQSATAVDGDAQRGECPPSYALVSVRPGYALLMASFFFPYRAGSAELDELLAALAATCRIESPAHSTDSPPPLRSTHVAARRCRPRDRSVRER